MNIFYLDSDVDKCAEAHVDRHVTKMQLEIAQMLCTNLWIDEVLGYIPRKVESDEVSELRNAVVGSNHTTSTRYKPCFFNHPCTIWMRESYEHFEYSALLVYALNEEAQWRGFAPHKSARLVEQLSMPQNMESAGFYQPAQAMPEERKGPDSVEAYRDYYMINKDHLATYTRREPPSWWVGDWNEEQEVDPAGFIKYKL